MKIFLNAKNNSLDRDTAIVSKGGREIGSCMTLQRTGTSVWNYIKIHRLLIPRRKLLQQSPLHLNKSLIQYEARYKQELILTRKLLIDKTAILTRDRENIIDSSNCSDTVGNGHIYAISNLAFSEQFLPVSKHMLLKTSM